MKRVIQPRGIHIALALLTFFTVFAATAGVRETLVTATRAVRQTLASATPLARTIMVSAPASNVSGALTSSGEGGLLTNEQLTEITDELHHDYNGYGHGVVRLAPASDDWAAVTSGLNLVESSLPAVDGVDVRLEITYRQPLADHMRLVAGQFPAAPPAPVTSNSGGIPAGQGGLIYYWPLLQVVVTRQTAATFGLHVGSKIKVPSDMPAAALVGGITFQVSGIVTPADPNSSFWTADTAPLVPELQENGSMTSPPYWVGGVIAGPGEATAVEQDFSSGGMTMQWALPLALGTVTGQQAQPLSDALTAIDTQTPPLSGDIEAAASALAADTPLLTTLTGYLATAQAVDALLWLFFVSLTVTGLAVLLLTARVVALRRSAELAVLRARGASLWQVALVTGRAAAIVCVPAAAIAVALAILAVPGVASADIGSAGGWWPQAAILAVAVCGPALIAAWQHRLPRHRVRGRFQRRGRVRLVTEVTLVAAAVGGIVVFRQQGTAPGSGVNLYTSAVPVLVAIPAVVVVLRIYPFALRGLLRASARSPGAPVFLGLARAARGSLALALPAFALVLVLTVAAFAGMVRDAVTNGDVTASWKAAGADVTISGESAAPGFDIPPAAAAAISAVPGVTHAAQAWPSAWVTANGTPIEVIAVDPASYAALTAAVPGAPAIPAGSLARTTTPGAAQPVLASAPAAAALGAGPSTIGTQAAVRPVTVRVAGVVSSTPAWPAGGAFLIMPLSALQSTATPRQPIAITELLLTGSGIDRARLATVMRKDLPPGGTAIYRSDVLADLTGAPVQHGAFVLMTLSVVVAAVLGLAVMFLELTLGAAEREATLARLATMGLGEGQRARVVALEVLPAVIAAAVAAWACALVLPRVVAPAIDLTAFTSTPVSVPLAPDASSFVGAVPLVPDVASVALPLAALIVVAALSLAVEIRSGRRRGVAGALRIGG